MRFLSFRSITSSCSQRSRVLRHSRHSRYSRPLRLFSGLANLLHIHFVVPGFFDEIHALFAWVVFLAVLPPVLGMLLWHAKVYRFARHAGVHLADHDRLREHHLRFRKLVNVDLAVARLTEAAKIGRAHV